MERRPFSSEPLTEADRPVQTANAAYPRPTGKQRGGLVIMHIALQGCLKGGAIDYGVTADTGGHIRYLLELVDALSRRPEIDQQIIVTRAFDAPHLGEVYGRREEMLGEQVMIWRCRGPRNDYLPKEDLWQELPGLTEALLQRMDEHGLRPDLVHAHYADAGVIACKLRARLSIPYIFTSHSLGATKARVSRVKPGHVASLRRRIRYEELAISGASGLIASSTHEARLQYGLYRHHRPEKTRVNPPGCDLSLFASPAPEETRDAVATELNRFLRRPERPCLLAIARPVEKKNLQALVRAFGEHPWLRAKANLVIFAGSGRDLSEGEQESREVWQALLRLIDQYDLYGSVAYPKHHEFHHVPAIYQWAAERRGVFVNPALNEPFGLTLLEAAAAGLPVVATREGGPVDIVERCQHGQLVTPTDTAAMAAACANIMANEQVWQAYSTRGRRNVRFYTWARHASQYIDDLIAASQPGQEISPPLRKTRMLATDMDGTLLGSQQGLASLKAWLARHPDCLLVLATGRSMEDAVRELRAWSAPWPDVIIADVGTAVYRMSPQGEPSPDPQWAQRLDRSWSRPGCQRVLAGVPWLTLQPRRTQTAWKLSYFVNDRQYQAGGDGESVLEAVRHRLGAAGLSAQVVLSHGDLLDILPPDGGKARAVEHVRRQFDIPFSELVAAGDSGNDIDLLSYAGQSIAVANHTPELERVRDLASVYWSRAGHAAGILEGLHYWFEDERIEASGQDPVPNGTPPPLEPPLAAAHRAGGNNLKAGA